VVARDAGTIDPDRDSFIAPEDVLAFDETPPVATMASRRGIPVAVSRR
jgi:hypothetical protein